MSENYVTNFVGNFVLLVNFLLVVIVLIKSLICLEISGNGVQIDMTQLHIEDILLIMIALKKIISLEVSMYYVVVHSLIIKMIFGVPVVLI